MDFHLGCPTKEAQSETGFSGTRSPAAYLRLRPDKEIEDGTDCLFLFFNSTHAATSHSMAGTRFEDPGAEAGSFGQKISCLFGTAERESLS